MAQRRDFINYFAFNSGELSPLMANRQDQARYAYGVKRMRNFIPALQGPARKRPGFKFVAEVADSSERVWFVPFIFSQTDAWVLIFGENTLRFVTDHGSVTEATKTITGITSANPGVLTISSHGYNDGDEVYIAGVGGTTELNGRFFKVANATAHTFVLRDLYGNDIDTSVLGAYTSGGTAARVYTVATPWAASDLTDANNGCCLMSWAQSGDVLYICVPGFQPRKLTRSAATSWSLAAFSPSNGPFETVDPDQIITVYAGASSGNTTLTASSGIFTSNHVGALFYLEQKLLDTVPAWEVDDTVTASTERRSQGHYYEALNNATTGTITPTHTEGSRFDGASGVNWQYLHSGYGWALITGYNSATSVNVTVISSIPTQAVGSGNASTRWALGSWSNESGWPTHVTFFRERLFFARGTRLWGSVPSDYENFAQQDAGIVAADSALSIDIRSGVNDDIQWMVPLTDLLIGTGGGEFSLGEISSADPLGPDNIAALSGPGYGSRQVLPAKINDAVMYVLPSGRVVRELHFTFESDGYSSSNRTAFAEHIAKGKLTQLAFAREPESIMWGSCENGDLIAMSFEREHELLAWHKHPLGGSYNDGATTHDHAWVETQCVIPSPTGDYDEVYVCGLMTVDGQTKRYIAYAEEHWDPDTDAVADQFYVDFGLTYSGASTSTLSNLHHLEGQTVQVFGDGKVLGDFTVSNGSVNLGSASVTKAQAGLQYTAILESMNIVRPGIMTRIVSVFVRFIATISAAWHTVTQRELKTETGTARPMQMGNVVLTGAPQPVSSLIKASGESGHGREMSWVITHDQPTYCNIAGVIPETNADARG